MVAPAMQRTTAEPRRIRFHAQSSDLSKRPAFIDSRFVESSRSATPDMELYPQRSTRLTLVGPSSLTVSSLRGFFPL
eukprot:4273821-Prymnesium_polylepis.1